MRRPDLEATHFADAKQEANLLLSKMSNLQPNLWTVDQQVLPLVQGAATYTVPSETVMILDAFIRFGGSSLIDRPIYPISRSEYSSYPNKFVQAFPTVYWFDRLISPTITLWQVPDGNGPYTLYYYRVRQIQDADYTGGLDVEVPYLWLDAFAAGLAYRLARMYAPAMEAQRKMDADEAWQQAATQNTENVNIMIAPGLSFYFR